MYGYSQFALADYASGEYNTVKQTAWYAYGAVSGKIKRFADWGADVKFYPSGYRGGDLAINAYLTLSAKFRGHPDSRSYDSRHRIGKRTYSRITLCGSTPLRRRMRLVSRLRWRFPIGLWS